MFFSHSCVRPYFLHCQYHISRLSCQVKSPFSSLLLFVYANTSLTFVQFLTPAMFCCNYAEFIERLPVIYESRASVCKYAKYVRSSAIVQPFMPVMLLFANMIHWPFQWFVPFMLLFANIPNTLANMQSCHLCCCCLQIYQIHWPVCSHVIYAAAVCK